MLHQASFTILCFYKRNFFSYLSACLSPPSPQIATHKESISIFRTTTYTFTALPKAAVDRRGILVQLLLFPNTYFPFLSPPFSQAPSLHASPSLGFIPSYSTSFIPFLVVPRARGKASVPAVLPACNKGRSIGGDAGRRGSGSVRRVRPYGTPPIMAAFITPQLSTVYRTIAQRTTPPLSLTPQSSISSAGLWLAVRFSECPACQCVWHCNVLWILGGATPPTVQKATATNT